MVIRLLFWAIIAVTCLAPMIFFLSDFLLTADLDFVLQVLKDPFIQESFSFTLIVGATTTTLSLFVGGLLALFLLMFPPNKSLLLSLFLIVAALNPPFVGPLGFQFLFKYLGVENQPFLGIILSQTIFLSPAAALVIEAALRNIDGNLIACAKTFNFSKLRIFSRIILPLISPALLNSGFIIFLAAITDLSSGLIFEERRLIGVTIFHLISDNPKGAGSIIIFVIFLIMSLLFLALKWLSSRFFVESISTHFKPLKPQFGFLTKLLLLASFMLIMVLNLTPQLFVATLSFIDFAGTFTLKHYTFLLEDVRFLRSLMNSLMLALLSSIIALVLSFFISLNSIKSKSVVAAVEESVSHLAYVLPSLFISFLLIVFYKDTFLDNQKVPLLLLALVFIFKKIPTAIRTFAAVLPQLSSELEASAKIFKIPVRKIWLKIYLPLLSVIVLRRFFVFFALAIFESSASLIIPFEEKFYPISKTVYIFIAEPDYFGPACAILTVLSLMIFLIAPFLLKLQIVPFAER